MSQVNERRESDKSECAKRQEKELRSIGEKKEVPMKKRGCLMWVRRQSSTALFEEAQALKRMWDILEVGEERDYEQVNGERGVTTGIDECYVE
jgi:hypothetical protein